MIDDPYTLTMHTLRNRPLATLIGNDIRPGLTPEQKGMCEHSFIPDRVRCIKCLAHRDGRDEIEPASRTQARKIIAAHLYRYHGRYEVSPLTLKELLGPPL